MQRPAGPTRGRLAIAAKVDRKHLVPFRDQPPGEGIPALLVEYGTVRQEHRVGSLPVEVGEDHPPVAGLIGDFPKVDHFLAHPR